MENNKMLNKQLLKKWWFWVVIVVILITLLGLSTDSTDTPSDTTTKDDSSTSQGVGVLPILIEDDYVSKEGLVIFKDLTAKGYSVKAEYVNEAVPSTNQELTEQFADADLSSCSDRLGWDAYVVSSLTQSGDNVSLVTTNKPNDNQECPAGTTSDL